MTRYSIQRTSQFKRDYKLALKRGYDVAKLRVVVTILMDGDRLPREYLDHPLKGRDYKEYRECHIEPDWLLIYKVDTSRRCVMLYRTGTHSDLFR